MVVWAHVNGLTCMDADIGTHTDESKDTYAIYDSSYKHGVEVEFHVREKGSCTFGGDVYQCIVITPDQLKNYSNLSFFGRGFYIVQQLTPNTLREAVKVITDKMNSTWGSSYHEVLLKLS